MKTADLTEKIQNEYGLILKALDRAGWKYKKVGTDKALGACPICRKGTKTPNTTYYLKDNSFICGSCQETGGIKKLCEALGIDFIEFLKEEGLIEEEQEVKGVAERSPATPIQQNDTNGSRKTFTIDLEKISSMVLSQETREYLLSRFIDPGNVNIRKYLREIRQKQLEAFKYLENYYKEGFRLLIPAFDTEDKLIFAKVRNIKGGDVKVKNLRGLTPSLIGLDRLKDIDKNDFVVIVEGEIDFLTALMVSPQDKIIAVPSSSYKITDKEIALLPDNVILLYDNDEAGKKGAEGIATQLRQKGKRVYIGEYPEGIKDFNELLGVCNGDLNKASELFYEVISKALQEPFLLVKTAKNIGESLLKELEEEIKKAEEEGKEKPEPKVLSTGLDFVDELLDGGFRRGLYAISGQPAIGKTSFILALAKHLAEQNVKSLIISLEMTGEDLVIQLLSWLTGISKRDLLDRSVSHYQYLELIDALNTHPVFRNIIIDAENRGIDQIKESITMAINDFQGEPLVVFIDYLQQIRPDKEVLKRAGSDYRIQMKDIAYRLKDIANSYNIPIVVISATQRDSYKKGSDTKTKKSESVDKEPNYLALFKESGDIEYSLYAGYYLDYPSDKDLAGYRKENTELLIKVVKVKSRFGSVRDDRHRNIFKIVSLDFKSGNLSEFKDEDDFIDDDMDFKDNTIPF